RLVCPQGHGLPPKPDARFCDKCGAQLIAAAVPVASPGVAPPPASPPQAPYPPPASLPQVSPAANRQAQVNPPAPRPRPAPPAPPYPPPAYPPQAVMYPQTPPPYPPPAYPQAPLNPASSPCQRCGGGALRLEASLNLCPQCHALRLLAPGYHLECTAFQWAQD